MRFGDLAQFRIALLCVSLVACSGAPEVAMLEGPRVAGKQSADPSLAVDKATGDLLMSWVEGDSSGYLLKLARSADGGATWTAPVDVTTSKDEVKPHAEASPRLVNARNVVGIFWPKQQHIRGRRFPASQMRFARSTDGGRTFLPPITVNDDTTAGAPAGHTFHGATVVGDSAFMVAWLDSREAMEATHGPASAAHHEGSSYVFSAASHDLGATWEPGNRKFWGNACPCCRVSLAPVGNDVLAAWRGHFEGDVRDIVVAKLVSDAQPERVHADNWVFPGCPHSGPGLAVEGDDVHVAWFTGAPGKMGVYYMKRGGKPVRIVSGEQLPTGHPAVTSVGKRAVVAVNLNSAGERVLTLARVNGDDVGVIEVPNSQGADHPQLLRIANNTAIVAWTQNNRLRLAKVTLE
jgi:hypothetical protein